MTDNTITPTVEDDLPLAVAQLWDRSKEELALQMTKATYNTWLNNTTMRPGVNGHDLVVMVRNSYALQWLDGRMRETIERTVRSVAERPDLVVSFVVDEAVESQLPDNQILIDDLDAIRPGNFLGFMPLESNWTKTPDQFFDETLLREDEAVIKIVGTVIRQTVGTFVDKRHTQSRQEWPVNNLFLADHCGLSRTSVMTGLWDARQRGYIVLRPITDKAEAAQFRKEYGWQAKFTLRLRYCDEGFDLPDHPRPGYGSVARNKRQKRG